ncbi:hypothetical protein NHX12_030103 [Muraenolepis orangiensis]|uniref:Uncharacterized protein n=1 Tax=Muraenolepis orangiensis TaxID=630683 RepID=A0A9Q0EBF4_9TELE|nr:hypothetical protein NHX12_030103 [Muraenolepis orangiensis]
MSCDRPQRTLTSSSFTMGPLKHHGGYSHSFADRLLLMPSVKTVTADELSATASPLPLATGSDRWHRGGQKESLDDQSNKPCSSVVRGANLFSGRLFSVLLEVPGGEVVHMHMHTHCV